MFHICILSRLHAILASFFFNNHVHIGGVMVSVPTSNAVDHKFEPQLVQTKDYKICICCFSAKHAALSIYHVTNKLIFNEVMMRSPLF
jgi:hypothetical protein